MPLSVCVCECGCVNSSPYLERAYTPLFNSQKHSLRHRISHTLTASWQKCNTVSVFIVICGRSFWFGIRMTLPARSFAFWFDSSYLGCILHASHSHTNWYYHRCCRQRSTNTKHWQIFIYLFVHEDDDVRQHEADRIDEKERERGVWGWMQRKRINIKWIHVVVVVVRHALLPTTDWREGFLSVSISAARMHSNDFPPFKWKMMAFFHHHPATQTHRILRENHPKLSSCKIIDMLRRSPSLNPPCNSNLLIYISLHHTHSHTYRTALCNDAVFPTTKNNRRCTMEREYETFSWVNTKHIWCVNVSKNGANVTAVRFNSSVAEARCASGIHITWQYAKEAIQLQTFLHTICLRNHRESIRSLSILHVAFIHWRNMLIVDGRLRVQANEWETEKCSLAFIVLNKFKGRHSSKIISPSQSIKAMHCNGYRIQNYGIFVGRNSKKKTQKLNVDILRRYIILSSIKIETINMNREHAEWMCDQSSVVAYRSASIEGIFCVFRVKIHTKLNNFIVANVRCNYCSHCIRYEMIGVGFL